MSSILTAVGFSNLESLREFSMRYPNIPTYLDSELEKIWICHKDRKNIPKFEEINLYNGKEYSCLYNEVKNKIQSAQYYTSLLTEFNAISIFEKMYLHFKGFLTTYIFTKCFVFYNWGVSSFEPVINHSEIHRIIEKNIQLKKIKKKSFEGCHPNQCIKCVDGSNQRCNNFPSGLNRKKKHRNNEFVCNSKILFPKTVTYQSLKTAIDKTEPFFDLPRNPNDSCQETFNLKRILYDAKQKSKWPSDHILSKNDVDKLLLFIIELPVRSNSSVTNKLLSDCIHWVKLKNLLRLFLNNHKIIEKNNGYGRILKKHLKSVKITARKLTPISKSIVSSYVIDILRKVFPLELFGCNRLRKKFFSSLSRLINATKEEIFMWYPLLRFLFEKKSNLSWCSEISDGYCQNQVILRLFKFIIIHYVFLIFRSNFYITETGSSAYGLRYYRKSEVESASFECLNSLLYYKHLRLFKKRDYDLFTIERKWIDSGVIEDRDLYRKRKIIMDNDTEYKQAVATIRFLPKNDWTDNMRIITNVLRSGNKLKNSFKSNPEIDNLLMTFEARSVTRNKNLYLTKLFIEFLIDKMGFGINPVPDNPKLEVAWNTAIRLKENFGKLYFVKADIADAFDSVRYDVLTRIILKITEKESFRNSLQLKNITEWKWDNSYIKKVSRVGFSNRPKENSVLISRCIADKNSSMYSNLNFLDIINQVAMGQRIEVNGKIFKLVKGLAQGSVGKFSPQLCEIYYSSMDSLYFGNIIKSKDSILLRGVDDYLLITPHVNMADRFLKIVRGGIENYNARFNNVKLMSNLIDSIHEVSYLGLIFNFDDMSVKPDYTKYLRKDLLSTMKLFDKSGSNLFNKNYFLERRSLLIKSLKLQRILLNKYHNDLQTARRIIFQACFMQATRVSTLAKYLHQNRPKNELTVWKVLDKSRKAIKNWVTKCCDITKDEVAWIFLFAVFCTFQKCSGQFKTLLVIVRHEFQKCERKFVNSGSELLLKFLIHDLIGDNYCKEVLTFFGKIRVNSKPFGTISY